MEFQTRGVMWFARKYKVTLHLCMALVFEHDKMTSLSGVADLGPPWCSPNRAVALPIGRHAFYNVTLLAPTSWSIEVRLPPTEAGRSLVGRIAQCGVPGWSTPAAFDGILHQTCGVADIQLVHDVPTVGFYGGSAQEEMASDLWRGAFLKDQLHDLDLAFGQRAVDEFAIAIGVLVASRYHFT